MHYSQNLHVCLVVLLKYSNCKKAILREEFGFAFPGSPCQLHNRIYSLCYPSKKFTLASASVCHGPIQPYTTTKLSQLLRIESCWQSPGRWPRPWTWFSFERLKWLWSTVASIIIGTSQKVGYQGYASRSMEETGMPYSSLYWQ